MKKSTLIIIMIIYIASIVVINFFGLSVKVYNEVINVTSIECFNETDDQATVRLDRYDNKEIVIKYDQLHTGVDEDEVEYKIYQLQIRVLPDNATYKSFRLAGEHKNVKFAKDGNGRDTGILMFYGKAVMDISIISTDGQNITTKLSIICR